MKVSIVATFISALTLFSANSFANIIATGVPVDASGNPLSASVLNSHVSGDGTIKFFIPLSGGPGGDFGINGAGLVSDWSDGSGGPGTLDMYLSFSPTDGGNALEFHFRDLDLIGVNDPYYFLESIAIYNQDMTTQIAFVDSASDPEVIVSETNGDNQKLLVSLESVLPLGDPFVAKLVFAAGPVRGDNTSEDVRVHLVGIQIPEPTSLLIFAIGVLGLGIISNRRRDKFSG